MYRQRIIQGAFLTATFLATTMAQAQWVWTPETGRIINTSKLPKETPELQVEYARGLMVGGEHKKAYQETEKLENFYPDSEFGDENQFLRGEIRSGQEQHLDAAKEFQQVISAYPESVLFDTVIDRQYAAGDTLYETGQRLEEQRKWYGWRPWKRGSKKAMKDAVEVYTMAKDNEPFKPRAAEAQYKVGLCHFSVGEYTEAAFEYRTVVEAYGTSEFVTSASYGLAKCYEASSLPSEYDQGPSLLAMDAVDTFRERYPTDARGEELEKVHAEMKERVAEQRYQTARFYERRQQYPSARTYYELVVAEFSGTRAAEKAQERLERY